MLQENLSIVKSEKEKLEHELKEQANNDKQESTKIINEQKQKIMYQEEQLQEIVRTRILDLSEFEKEKALLNQRVSFQEKQMEELSKKDKEQSNDIKGLKKEYSSQVKEVTNKYELLNKQLQQKISELTEKIYELESDLTSKNQKHENEKLKWETNEANLAKLLEESQLYIQKLQTDIKELRQHEEQNSSFLQNDLMNNINLLKDKNGQYEDLLKEKEDSLINQKNSYQKEKALLQQKIEFLQVQFEESKQQLEENKRAHEAIMKALESSTMENSGKFDNKQYQELKESHTREIKTLETDFEKARKRYVSQIDALNEKNSELEMKVKFEEADYQKEIEQLNDLVGDLRTHNERLEAKNQSLEEERTKVFRDAETRFINKIRNLEEEIDHIKQTANKDIRDSQSKSEESLQQLKNIYEIERVSLEKRLAEDKEKWEKRYQLSSEEYQEQLREAQHNYEEEIENLKEDLREQENQYHSVVQQYEHELALKQQQLETLEKYTKETKDSLLNLQNSNNSNLEQHINNFNVERKNLVSKIEGLTSELSRKEKDNIALTQKKENLESNLKKREAQIQQIKTEMQSERGEATNYVDDLKQKLQIAQEEQITQKIDFSREIALSNQRVIKIITKENFDDQQNDKNNSKNEFLTKKNEDLSRQNENQISHYEEKLRTLKTEMNLEFQDKTEKLSNQRDVMEEKYEKTKKNLKEIEATYNKQLSQIEKERAIYQEKYGNSESKKQEIEMKYQAENQNYVMQILKIKEQAQSEKKAFLNEIDKLKSMNLCLEQDKNEQITNYERDKALWEGKFQFFEQQKEQAKQDLQDALRKFEQTLQHLQKARSNEKEDHESSLNELLVSMEKKFQNQINELNENNQRSIQDYEDKLRRANKELKTLKESILVEKHGKLGSQMINERKLADYIEVEKKLLAEIDQLKNDRDQKSIEYQRQLEFEKENLRNKNSELEQKCKEIEQKRGTLIFEHEKERAKWNLDKDHLLVTKNELQDHIDKLEKKKDILLRENEKLRNDSRATRRSVNMMGNQLSSNPTLSSSKSNIKKSGLLTNPSYSPISNSSSISKNSQIIQQDNYGGSQFNNLKPNNNNLNDITNFTGIIPYDQARQINMKHFSSQEDELEIQQQQQYSQLQPPQQYNYQDQMMAQMLQNGGNSIYNGQPSAPVQGLGSYSSQGTFNTQTQQIPFQIERFKYSNNQNI